MGAVVALSVATATGLAGERGTKPEAIAMVKSAVDFIKANGAQKTYDAVNAKAPAFHDRDLYVTIYDQTGKCLAHGNNAKLAGKDLSEAQDADGVYFVRNRMTAMKSNASFWQDYKFSDPLTKKLEPKSTYCEKLNDTAVCVGIYK
jgi:signal transduction histidine kinase